MADDGGSSGRLREDMDIPAPGDIRNVLAALSDVEPLVEQMFQHRFQSQNELSGHSLGNLILAAMTSLTGDFVHAIQEMSKFLNVRGKVLPAANQSVVLHAEMDDGTIVTGESKIPFSGKKIKKCSYLLDISSRSVKPFRKSSRLILLSSDREAYILAFCLIYLSLDWGKRSAVPRLRRCTFAT